MAEETVVRLRTGWVGQGIQNGLVVSEVLLVAVLVEVMVVVVVVAVDVVVVVERVGVVVVRPLGVEPKCVRSLTKVGVVLGVEVWVECVGRVVVHDVGVVCSRRQRGTGCRSEGSVSVAGRPSGRGIRNLPVTLSYKLRLTSYSGASAPTRTQLRLRPFPYFTIFARRQTDTLSISRDYPLASC